MSKTALLFAGQGAQVVGMGRDLAERYPMAEALFEQANATLGYDLTSICFNGPEEVLTQTEHAQPGIFLVSWVAFKLLRNECPGLEFHACAGLSLGEFTALAAGGAFGFEQGLTTVRRRGVAMQQACEATRGGMAAVIGLEEAKAREVCAETGVELANLNCPGQIVISGEEELLTPACDLAKERGARKAVPLPVAGAYHSRLMASAQGPLGKALGEIEVCEPSVPVMSNVTGRAHASPEEIRARLVEQVTAPVRWEDCVRELMARGITRFIELGPGKTLSGFMKRIDRDADVMNVADVASLTEVVERLQA